MLLSANRKPSFITRGNSGTGNHSIVSYWNGWMQEERIQDFISKANLIKSQLIKSAMTIKYEY